MRSLLVPEKIAESLLLLDGWTQDKNRITKLYQFGDYHAVMAFVNAIAWISHQHDHHPELQVGYNTCRIQYTTHDAGGLTRKDFDCAAAIDALFRP